MSAEPLGRQPVGDRLRNIYIDRLRNIHEALAYCEPANVLFARHHLSDLIEDLGREESELEEIDPRANVVVSTTA